MGRLPGTGTYSGSHVCPIARTGRVLPAAVVESATVVESAAIVVPAIAVVLAAVVLAVLVLAFLVLAAVVVALVVFALAVVAAEEPAAAEQAAQRFGRQNSAADAEGDLACPGQETLAARSLPAGGLLVRRPVTAVALLTGASSPGLGEPGRRSALPELLLAVGKLGPQLPERGLLSDQRLRHVIEQTRRPLLNVLLDPGLGLRIPRPCLPGGPVQVLEQVVDGLLILLIHT
jgi:hypothetical protein